MNGSIAIFLLAVVSISLVAAMPTLEDSPKAFVEMEGEKSRKDTSSDRIEPLELEGETQEIEGRFKRATCDLLSVSTKWGSLNHSACAAHCLAMRRKFRGGYCSNGVCHCRR